GAEHNHTAVRGDVRHGVGKVAYVGCGGREDLSAHALACLVGVADEVALHRIEALGIGKPIGIDLADGAHNVARELHIVEVGASEEVRGAVIGVERGDQIRITIRHEGKAARIAVEHALAPISAALHPDLVPQPGAQIAAGHEMGTARLYALATEGHPPAARVGLRCHAYAFPTPPA